MKKVMLSTIDNPHSPFDDYPAWYSWDVMSGYYSTSFLSRIAQVSDHLSDADYDLAIEQAIDEIISENVSGVFIKVEKIFPD
jgi:hypothetical protein